MTKKEEKRRLEEAAKLFGRVQDNAWKKILEKEKGEMDMKEEWKRQIKRCEETIARYKKMGWLDAIPEIEKIKKEAEQELKRLS